MHQEYRGNQEALAAVSRINVMSPPWMWNGLWWWLSAIGLGLVGTVGAAFVACLGVIDVLSWATH